MDQIELPEAKFLRLKLELSAVLHSYGSLTEKEIEQLLYQIFRKEYKLSDIKRALKSLQELQTTIELTKEESNVIVYPDDHFQGN